MYVCVCFLCKHMHAYQCTHACGGQLMTWLSSSGMHTSLRNTTHLLWRQDLSGLELMSYTGYAAEPQEFPFSTSLVLQLVVHTITLAFTRLWGIELRSSSLLATHFTH